MVPGRRRIGRRAARPRRDVRRRRHFGEYMANLGMKSQTTVSKRFALDNWKDYELSGVRQVINSLFEQ